MRGSVWVLAAGHWASIPEAEFSVASQATVIPWARSARVVAGPTLAHWVVVHTVVRGVVGWVRWMEAMSSSTALTEVTATQA